MEGGNLLTPGGALLTRSPLPSIRGEEKIKKSRFKLWGVSGNIDGGEASF